jgi:hypothetical protein
VIEYDPNGKDVPSSGNARLLYIENVGLETPNMEDRDSNKELRERLYEAVG